MKILPFLCLVVAVSLVTVVSLHADEAKATVSKEHPQVTPVVQQTFELLMDCIEQDQYSAFSVVIDDDFKAALTEKVFKSVVAQIAPRQKKGFQSIYLEQLRRGGYESHLWKMTFDDGGDDILVTLSIKDGKVGGLLLQ